MKTEALFWEVIDDEKKIVQCNLCPHRCKLRDGKYGICGVRKNEGGKLYTYTYGSLVAMALDPVEKKPLYHFYPGHKTLTIATPGCNFKCLGCQNWEISQVSPEDTEREPVFSQLVEPSIIVEKALEVGAKSISFSYTEPTIYFEYMLDISKLAKEKGLYTIMVSNAYIEKEPLEVLLDYIDAFSFDLKFFSDEQYRKYAKGRLEPVLSTIKKVFEAGKWLEITTLLVPQFLDLEQIEKIALWIKEELSDWVPWHISRFFPQYKTVGILPPTPEDMIFQAYEIGKRIGLKYIYVGNFPLSALENTYCPNCGKLLIKRQGFFIVENYLKGPYCPFCGHKIEIVL